MISLNLQPVYIWRKNFGFFQLHLHCPKSSFTKLAIPSASGETVNEPEWRIPLPGQGRIFAEGGAVMGGTGGAVEGKLSCCSSVFVIILSIQGMNFWTVSDRKWDFIDFTPHANTCFMLSAVYKTKAFMHFFNLCFLCVWEDAQSLKCYLVWG